MRSLDGTVLVLAPRLESCICWIISLLPLHLYCELHESAHTLIEGVYCSTKSRPNVSTLQADKIIQLQIKHPDFS